MARTRTHRSSRLARAGMASLDSLAMLALGAACGGDDQPAADAGSTSSLPADADFNQADVEFASGMIPHHRQAVMMAEMVEGRDVEPAIADLAAEIRDAQQPEIEQLEGFLDEWGAEPAMDGMDHSDMGQMGGMGMMSPQQMSSLRTASDAEFGDRWLELMIEHHRGAVEMSRTQIADGEDAEAVALAEDIAQTQAEEIATMQDLLAG